MTDTTVSVISVPSTTDITGGVRSAASTVTVRVGVAVVTGGRPVVDGTVDFVVVTGATTGALVTDTTPDGAVVFDAVPAFAVV